MHIISPVDVVVVVVVTLLLLLLLLCLRFGNTSRQFVPSRLSPLPSSYDDDNGPGGKFSLPPISPSTTTIATTIATTSRWQLQQLLIVSRLELFYSYDLPHSLFPAHDKRLLTNQ